MKINLIQFFAVAIIAMAFIMFSSIATETTWRHSGFELWGYDINMTGHDLNHVNNLTYGNDSIIYMDYSDNIVPHYQGTLVDGVSFANGYLIDTTLSTSHSSQQLYFNESGTTEFTNFWAGSRILFNSNSNTGYFHGIAMNITDTSVAGPLAVTGIEITIDSPPDRGGDTSGLYVRQEGGGNGVSVYTNGTGYALEVGGLSGSNTAMAISQEGNYESLLVAHKNNNAAVTITNESTNLNGVLFQLRDSANTRQVLKLYATGDIWTQGEIQSTAYTGVGNEYAYFDTNGVLNRGSLDMYGEAYIYNNAVDTVIETANTPIALRQISSGLVNGWTFDAGSTGGITAYADGTGGKVLVSDAGHGLSNGDIITIRGTTNYNGVFTVSDVTTDNFKITDTWVNDNGASDWDQGASLTAGANSAGKYSIRWQMSSAPDAAMTCKWVIYINAVAQTKTTGERKFTQNDFGCCTSMGILDISAGDVVWLAIQSDGTQNVLNKHGNFNVRTV